jgi:hypothetical protein
VIARRLVDALLGRGRGGRLEVVEGGARRGFGPPDAELRAEIRVRDPAF